MTALLIAMVLIPAVDQASKRVLRRRLARRTLSLGALGHLRLVQTDVWTLRLWPQVSLRAMWLLWALGAGASAGVAAVLPSSAWALALMVSGALSHAIEMSWRGSIVDYVCLRFWPAFNLADVAIALGAVGFVSHLLAAAS
jgi:hypothetical protein